MVDLLDREPESAVVVFEVVLVDVGKAEGDTLVIEVHRKASDRRVDRTYHRVADRLEMVVASEEVVHLLVEDTVVDEVAAVHIYNFCRQIRRFGIHRRIHRNREELAPDDLDLHEVDHIDPEAVHLDHCIVGMAQDEPSSRKVIVKV